VRSNVELKRQLDKRYGFEGIIGGSEPMQNVFDTLRQVSGSMATVLILGESGTGKELVARAIHANSPRRGNHFVPLNCAALSETILESELFGHEKGAFTGATQTRKGRFEYAHGGTLFLDEIGDLPPDTQVKLLRVIEYGEVTRIGANESFKVDVRLIAATNKDLLGLVREGKFREDLYYRLKVVTVDLPPLRERLEDLPLLVQSFIDEFSKRQNRKSPEITPAAMELLYNYDWPGNVRELRNCVEAMVALDKDGKIDAGGRPEIRQAGGRNALLPRTRRREPRRERKRSRSARPWRSARATGKRRPRCWGSANGRCTGRSSAMDSIRKLDSPRPRNGRLLPSS
jgi:two-component system response regulator HydG